MGSSARAATVTQPPFGPAALRRGAAAWAFVATGCLSLASTYVLPIAMALRQAGAPAQVRAALPNLQLPSVAPPLLRVPHLTRPVARPTQPAPKHVVRQ